MDSENIRSLAISHAYPCPKYVRKGNEGHKISKRAVKDITTKGWKNKGRLMDYTKGGSSQNLPSKYNKNGETREPDFFSFMVKRTAKLSSALYLVTNLISDTEPIKWKLRERTLAVLSDTASFRYQLASEKMHLFSETQAGVVDILALLEVARAGGLISEMNFQILKYEYEKLTNFMVDKYFIENEAEESIREFLKEEREERGEGAFLRDRKMVPPQYSKGHLKGQYDDLYKKDIISVSKRHAEPFSPTGTFEKYAQGKKESWKGKVKTRAGGDRKDTSKIERKSVILSLAKEKGSINVKDVAAVIVGLSEKTIQRELVTLVKNNVLKKEGEKRWSRYSLV